MMTAPERLRKVANEVNEDTLGPILNDIDQAMKIAADCGKYFYITTGFYDSNRAKLIADYYQRQGFEANWNYRLDTSKHCYVFIEW
jgi:hypothetical protein